MKQTIFMLMMAIGLTSCYNRIGSLTVVATRNVDPNGEYVELRRGVTAESRMSKGQALQEAIDRAVKAVPGGEYMTNCVVYVRGNSVIKVTGDVYGRKGDSTVTGSKYNVGDQIVWLDDRDRKVKAKILYIGPNEVQIELLHNHKVYNTTLSRIVE